MIAGRSFLAVLERLPPEGTARSSSPATGYVGLALRPHPAARTGVPTLGFAGVLELEDGQSPLADPNLPPPSPNGIWHRIRRFADALTVDREAAVLDQASRLAERLHDLCGREGGCHIRSGDCSSR